MVDAWYKVKILCLECKSFQYHMSSYFSIIILTHDREKSINMPQYVLVSWFSHMQKIRIKKENYIITLVGMLCMVNNYV